MLKSKCHKYSPLFGNLILSFDFLLFKLSDISHSNLFAEFHKYLILHLEDKNSKLRIKMKTSINPLIHNQQFTIIGLTSELETHTGTVT